MSPDKSIETKWGRLISWILLQIALGFGVGLVAAFGALVATGLLNSDWLAMAPTWLLPIAVLALINMRLVSRARAPLNVTLFLFAAVAGEIAVLCVIAGAVHP